MEVMISINPPYTQMIFNGYKQFEFRKKVLKGMDEGYPLQDIKAYIYETKNKGGLGKVIGEVTIPGTYCLHYGDKKYPDEELVKVRLEFIKWSYLQWCELKKIKPNMNEGWFKSKKFNEYKKEIGFFNKDDKLECNYALILDESFKYETPKDISDFMNIKNISLCRPPQNMFHVKYERKISDGTF